MKVTTVAQASHFTHSGIRRPYVDVMITEVVYLRTYM